MASFMALILAAIRAGFSDYTAAARGSSLVIVKKTAGSFTPALAVTPAGALATG